LKIESRRSIPSESGRLDDADLTEYVLAAMKRLVLALFLVACGGGTSTPSISNMTYAPQTAPAGTDTVFDVTFDFDTNLDVTTIEFVLLNSPAGPSKTPQDFPVDITFQTPGSYEFGIDVLDSSHKASNQLTGVITVQ
jgi:hypothetical protein